MNARTRRFCLAAKTGYLVGTAGDWPNLTNEWRGKCGRRKHVYICAISASRKHYSIEIDTAYCCPYAHISGEGVKRLEALVQPLGLSLSWDGDRRSLTRGDGSCVVLASLERPPVACCAWR